MTFETRTSKQVVRGALLGAFIAATLSACGGDSTSPTGPPLPPPPTGALVAGTVTGIVPGRPLTLTNSSGETVTVIADGAFRFLTQLDFNGTYRVTVSSVPSGQACSVLYGSGAASSGFDHVQVLCGPLQQSTFRTTAALRSPRERHLQVARADGTVLVFGGDDLTSTGGAPTEVRAIERYDPVADRWNDAGTLPAGVHVAQAMALPTGRIVLLTTQPASPTSPVRAYRYDPESATLTPGASATGLTTADTAVVMFTAQVMASDGTNLELYDAGVDLWYPADAFRSRHLNGTLTVIGNGDVLATGGFGSDGNPTAASEVYGLVTHHWTGAGDLRTGRAGHAAALLPNGRVLAVAGYGAAVGSTSPTLPVATQAEQYDPTTRSWLPAGSPITAREGATATLMPSGRVLLVGGDVQSVVQPVTRVGSFPATLDSAETYDPQTNAWASFGRLNAARTRHAAARTVDGRLLVSGGYVSTANVPPTGSVMDWTNALVLPGEVGY